MKWLLIPSYPLMMMFIDLLPHTSVCWLFVVFYGAHYVSELLSILQILSAYFRGKKSLLDDLWDENIDHFVARLPQAAASFALAYFCYGCLWFVLPLTFVRAPM